MRKHIFQVVKCSLTSLQLQDSNSYVTQPGVLCSVYSCTVAVPVCRLLTVDKQKYVY